MVVSPNGEVCGQFNIIFKPLPQFDNKHVVFGRVSYHPITNRKYAAKLEAKM